MKSRQLAPLLCLRLIVKQKTFIEYFVLEYNASSSTRHTRGQVGNRGLWVGWGEIKIKMPLRNNLSRLSVEEKKCLRLIVKGKYMYVNILFRLL